MGNFDGSHLKKNTRKSKSLVKTAINLLTHCILVSSVKPRRNVRAFLEGTLENGEDELEGKLDTPFEIVGNSLYVNATQSTSAARAYIVENKNSVVIAFRGSGVKNESGTNQRTLGTLQNALVDVSIRFIEDSKFPGKVHKGFSSDYMQVREEILRRMENVNLKNKTLYITGFSLGAALAVLCAYDLKKTLNIEYINKDRETVTEEINPHVYLFAPPAVGNHDFTRKAEVAIPSIFRFTHEKDIIGQIPHGLLCSYKATGNKLFVFDEKAKQVHHKDIKLLINAKRSLQLARIHSGLTWAVIFTIIYKTVRTFKCYHTPNHYKKKLANLHRNYDENIQSNSNLRQAADKQYQECQQNGISFTLP